MRHINDVAFPNRLTLHGGRWITAEQAELLHDHDGAAEAIAEYNNARAAKFGETLVCAAGIIALFAMVAYGFGGLR
jgi:hypothetical protein